MSVGYLGEILITLGVAWIYLTIVRFVDVNEREPVWAMATVFALGLLAACAAELLAGSERLTVPVWRGAFVVEGAKLIALLGGILIFSGVARVRGWSEFTDLTDGIVYGIAVGLGYSTGETLIREVATAHVSFLHTNHSGLQSALNAAAGGLSHGVFAAVAGLGVGAAFGARRRFMEVFWTLLGLAGAVLLNGAFRILAHGRALDGEAGHVRAWLAVVLPMLVLIAVGLVSLLAERRAIRAELASEVAVGTVTPAEAALLDSFWRRQLTYMGLLARGRVGRCLHLAALHNRQVQLALLKRQAARESDPAHRERMEHRASLIRGAIRHARSLLVLALLVAGSLTIGAGKPRPVVRTDWPTLDSLLGVARRDIDDYWRTSLGVLYRAPAGVGAYPAIPGKCPFLAGNAVYCSPDRHIYYDRALLDSLWRGVGDFAAVFVVAHEWGHLIEDLRGELSPLNGRWTIETELEADCLAGQWAGDPAAKHILEPGDREEAISSLRKASTESGAYWFRTGAHGTGEQRVQAFTEGLERRTCVGDDFIRRVHADEVLSQRQVGMIQGALLTITPCRVGRFSRTAIRYAPEVFSETMNDAVVATFRAADGTEISEVRFAFRTIPAAQANYDGVVQQHREDRHYTLSRTDVMRTGNLVTGEWALLDGTTQVLAMRDHQLNSFYEGPAGPTWEFATSKSEWNCATP